MGGFKSFSERMPANLDKMKSVVHVMHGTSELSFSPVMGATK